MAYLALIFLSLVFGFSLVFLTKKIPWCFQLFFPVFLGFVLGSRGVKKIVGVLGAFPWLLPKRQGMEDQVGSYRRRAKYGFGE